MSLPRQPQLLHGRLVTLAPLRADDAESLFPSASDPEVWRWKLVPRPNSVADMARIVTDVMLGAGRWPFLISASDNGRRIGSTTLANFDWRHGCVEMGFTWLERSAWGRGYNEDSKLILLGHCFEDLELHRVEWQVDHRNERSIGALHRLGFHYEGAHRSRHVRPDGSRRDSLYFSLLATEWPTCRLWLHELIDKRSSKPDSQ